MTQRIRIRQVSGTMDHSTRWPDSAWETRMWELKARGSGRMVGKQEVIRLRSHRLESTSGSPVNRKFAATFVIQALTRARPGHNYDVEL